MAERVKKDDFERVRGFVDKKIAERMEHARAAALKRSRGDEWVALRSRTTRAGVLGRWEWFAARFEPAAGHWRNEWDLQLELSRASAAEKAAKEAGWLGRLLRRSPREPAPPGDSTDFGDPDSTRLRHLSAWQVGRMDLFAAATEHEASDEKAWRVHPRDWRLMGRPAPHGWWARERERLDGPGRQYVRQEHRDPRERAISEAHEIDTVIARHLFWLGDTAEAHEVLERVIAATADWLEGRVRIWPDETPDMRAAYGGELRALHALTRPDGAGHAEAVAHARAALLGCIRSASDGDPRHEDLPWIHVVAMARSEPKAAAIAEFRTHLPWLAHLLDWRG